MGPSIVLLLGGQPPQALSFLLLRGLNPSEATLHLLLHLSGRPPKPRGSCCCWGGLTPLGADALLLRSGRGPPPSCWGGVTPPSLKSLLLLRFALTTFFL